MRYTFAMISVFMVLVFVSCELEGGAIVGPGGGFVFYDKGSYSDGWRYLEAAPKTFDIETIGEPSKNVSNTQAGIGQGKRNTELILETEKSGAAALCAEYSHNGYDDWFIPSIYELAELPKRYFFDDGNCYLSSTNNVTVNSDGTVRYYYRTKYGGNKVLSFQSGDGYEPLLLLVRRF